MCRFEINLNFFSCEYIIVYLFMELMFREGGCGLCVVGFSSTNILTNKKECRAVHSVIF
jgi:hypothetical protein